MERTSHQQQQQRRPDDGINDSGASDEPRRMINNNNGNAQNGSRNSNTNANTEQGRSPYSPPSTPTSLSSEAASNSAPSSSLQGNDEANTNSNRTSSNKNDEGVGSLRDYDVLMGRGSGPNRHVGNIHFRSIVGEVFDDFLEKHCGGGNLSSRSEMLRIDPSTKNRLAQAVLDKITLEKKGRFLQKLTKKEIVDATKIGVMSKLIRARANSMDAAAMAAEAAATRATGDSEKEEDANSQETSVNAIVYYKIIPEKQILAKIKQTFRFLRDQNEVSYAAEKYRQRAKRMACRGSSREPSLSASSSTSLRSLNASSLSSNSSLAAYALLSHNHQFGAVINPNPLSQQLSFGSSGGNVTSSLNGVPNGNNLWAGRNMTSRMGAISSVAASPLSSLNSLKNCTLNAGAIGTTSGNMDLASRILCDLPQPNRIVSVSNPVGGASSIFGGSPSLSLSAAMSSSAQGASNSNSSFLNKANPAANQLSTKRLLEELTLSRLIHLQKQREQTISAYLSLEREATRTSAGSRISPINRLLDNMSGTGSGNSTTTNMTTPSNVIGMTMGALGGMNGNSSSVGNNSLTLLLQLQNSVSNGTNTNLNHQQLTSISSGKNSLRAFNSF